jgi:hypothetical protein
MENSRTGRVTVTGGVLTAQQIVSQLQCLVPVGEYHWDVQPTEDNLFRVLFPSKEELERLKVFGDFRVLNTACTMTVQSWGARLQPLNMLQEAWIRVFDVPSRHRGDYLAMWALGTLFGKTLQVDMPFTRQHGVVRIRIGCMDISRIPDSKHVYIKDGIYHLASDVEDMQLCNLLWMRICMRRMEMMMIRTMTMEMLIIKVVA